MDWNKLLKFTAEWVVLLLALVVIRHFEITWGYYVLGVLAVLVIVKRFLGIRNAELFLEVGCDADRYLRYIEEKKVEGNEDQYNLQKAYGLIYKGKVDEAELCFAQVNIEAIEDQEKYYPIYIRTKTKILFEKKDDKSLRQLLEQVVNSEDYNDDVYKNYIKIFLLLLDNRYEEAINQLVESVPEQYNRVQVVELEYYLAYAYKMDERFKDAHYVAGFIVKKGYNVIYTQLCDEIYEELYNKVNQ